VWKVTPRDVGVVQPQRKLAELQYILVELVDTICADGIDSRGHNVYLQCVLLRFPHQTGGSALVVLGTHWL